MLKKIDDEIKRLVLRERDQHDQCTGLETPTIEICGLRFYVTSQNYGASILETVEEVVDCLKNHVGMIHNDPNCKCQKEEEAQYG